MTSTDIDIDQIVKDIDHDLQLETDFRLSATQRALLVLNHRVTISYLTFRPFAERAHKYLARTSQDDRLWSCSQDLASLDYTIYIVE